MLSLDALSGQAFNIGNPRCVITVYNLAREIIRLCESKSRIVFQEVDRADVEIRVPSIKKARALLQYEPKIDLEEGLLKTIAWYREIKDAETAAAAAPVLAQATAH